MHLSSPKNKEEKKNEYGLDPIRMNNIQEKQNKNRNTKEKPPFLDGFAYFKHF